MSRVNRTHRVKTHPQMFADVVTGQKTFEVRRDDRGYRTGDILRLVEYPVAGKDCLCDRRVCPRRGDMFDMRIEYILRGGEWGIEAGYIVMGLSVIGEPQ